MKKLIGLLIICVIFFTFSFSSLGHTSANASTTLSSFRDIPGITAEEIAAVNAVIEGRDYFTYAMLLSSEAFYTLDGEISGFTYRITNWLTELFGIPFVPKILDWNSLIDGLEDGSVDFTGQLTRTPERLEILAMTDPIVMRSISYAVVADTPYFVDFYRPPRFAFLNGSV